MMMLFGRTLQAVVWQQGTLMTPQHLQHQDAHHHAHLAARLHGAAPRSTGLMHLRIDHLALQEGKVNLPSGAAIMPLGECLEWHELEGTAPPCRALPDAELVPNQRLDVYLVLPGLRPGSANITHQRSARECRYLAETVRLPDLTQGATPAADIMLAKPQAFLAFGHELKEGDCRLHLMRLIRLPHGGAQLDASFLPQSLRIQAQNELVTRLQALHRAVATSEARLRPKPRQPATLTAVDAALRHRGLVQLHTVLSDLLGDPLTAPIDVYRQLRACLAWLSAPLPREEELCATAVRFDDARPGDALWPLVTVLEQAVLMGPLPVHLYPARQMAKSGLFIANLAPWPKKEAATQWYLQVVLNRTDGAPVDGESMRRLGDAWQRLAKVAAPSQMPRLIRSALRGIALQPPQLEAEGDELAAGPGTLVFALDTSDAGWPLVEAEGDVVLLPPPHGIALPQHSIDVALICRAAAGVLP